MAAKKNGNITKVQVCEFLLPVLAGRILRWYQNVPAKQPQQPEIDDACEMYSLVRVIQCIITHDSTERGRGRVCLAR